MRTLADRQNERNVGRYEKENVNLDPSVKSDANAILLSQGGSKAAKIALAELWKQANEDGQGYLPTARLSAPLRVMIALETAGVVTRATDDRGRAIRFRLSDAGLTAAVRATNGEQPK